MKFWNRASLPGIALIMIFSFCVCTPVSPTQYTSLQPPKQEQSTVQPVTGLSITNVLASDISHDIATISWTTGKQASNVTWHPDDAATITWTTNQPATSQVEFGRSNSYEQSTPLNKDLITNHSVSLGKLPTDVIYHFRVRSTNGKGQEVISGDYTYGWCNSLVPFIAKAGSYDDLVTLTDRFPKNYLNGIDTDSLIQWIERGFKYYPPLETRKRDALFIALDLAALSTRYHVFTSFQQHIADTTQRIYEALQKSQPTNDLTIYKLYNEGTIIKTSGICFGIDIFLDTSSKKLAPYLANMLDALFITHRHDDHWDVTMEVQMEKARKPVIFSEDNSSIPLGGVTASGRIGDMKWTAFRGEHLQGSFFRSMIEKYSGFFIFEIGNFSILHSGDNVTWMNFVESDYAKNIDVFLTNTDSVYKAGQGEYQNGQEALEVLLSKMRPRFIIPHHLLELIRHDIRACGYNKGLRLYRQSPPETQVQMLHWGEAFSVPPKKL